MADRHTPEQRRRNMRAVKNKDSKTELRLRRILWTHGLRFRKNYSGVPGKPDIAFTRYKLAIFIDGDFWHGRDWEIRKKDIKSNRDFWYPKIERTIARDREVNEQLAILGWRVLRFWEKDIQRDHDAVVENIRCTLRELGRP